MLQAMNLLQPIIKLKFPLSHLESLLKMTKFGRFFASFIFLPLGFFHF
jgi:hypothetical protein